MISAMKFPTGINRYQWFFSLFTSSVLLALGYGLVAIGSSGTSLIVLAIFLVAFSTHYYVLAPALKGSAKTSLTTRLIPLGVFSRKQENVL